MISAVSFWAIIQTNDSNYRPGRHALRVSTWSFLWLPPGGVWVARDAGSLQAFNWGVRHLAGAAGGPISQPAAAGGRGKLLPNCSPH